MPPRASSRQEAWRLDSRPASPVGCPTRSSWRSWRLGGSGKAGPMAITQGQIDGLWGDGGPYSQVHVIREIRILDDEVSRIFHYVKGNVNPTTYAVLKTMENDIEDEDIRAFLQEATFVSDEEGYEWHVYGQQAAST